MLKKVILVAGLFVVLFVGVCDLMPFHDDWCYATAPNPDFEWSQLLPSAAFWRPFDVLWGALMARMPSFFPVANRLAVILAHAFSSLLVWEVLSKIAGDKLARIVGTLFFAVSSVIAATLFNSDTINQSWSFLMGILALWFALKYEKVSWKRWVTVNGLVLLSMLFKGSGVSWLAVIPLILFWRERNIKNLFVRWGVGIALLVFYFAMRFVLMGKVVVGGEYYTLGFNLKNVIVNFLMAVILPLSGFDMLAFACGHWSLMVVSVISSCVFWYCWVVSARCDEIEVKVWMLVLTAIAFVASHCFSKVITPQRYISILSFSRELCLLRLCPPRRKNAGATLQRDVDDCPFCLWLV